MCYTHHGGCKYMIHACECVNVWLCPHVHVFVESQGGLQGSFFIAVPSSFEESSLTGWKLKSGLGELTQDPSYSVSYCRCYRVGSHRTTCPGYVHILEIHTWIIMLLPSEPSLKSRVINVCFGSDARQ